MQQHYDRPYARAFGEDLLHKWKGDSFTLPSLMLAVSTHPPAARH